MTNPTTEIPENQMDIFDILDVAPEPQGPVYFKKQYANWQPTKLFPAEKNCRVVGIIPVNVWDPSERKWVGIYPGEDWGEQQDIWSAYVWAIALLIPQSERAANDPNAWEAASAKLKEVRDHKTPIVLEIWEHNADLFSGLEVVEYLKR